MQASSDTRGFATMFLLFLLRSGMHYQPAAKVTCDLYPITEQELKDAFNQLPPGARDETR